MKILLDNGLSRHAAELLRGEHAFDAIHVSDIGFGSADDVDIIELAVVQHRVIITLDADFHTHLARHGLVWPSVIRLRFEGMKARTSSAIILRLLRRFEVELTDGAAISAGPKFARCHMLPLK